MPPDGQDASGFGVGDGGVPDDSVSHAQVIPAPVSPADAIAVSLTQHAHAACGAFAPNTERALRADVAVFTGWCVAAGLSAPPATPATVAAFVDAMGATKAPATIRRYVSSIATFHRAARLANPCTDEVVRLALKRLHRARGRAQAQAAPLTRDLVDRMLAAAGSGTRVLRNRALLSVAYDSLCRRSELVALELTDLETGSGHESALSVRLTRTKQENRR